MRVIGQASGKFAVFRFGATESRQPWAIRPLFNHRHFANRL